MSVTASTVKVYWAKELTVVLYFDWRHGCTIGMFRPVSSACLI